MKFLTKHELDESLTTKYLEKTLDQVNTLSEMILEVVDFQEGHFFTYLFNKNPIKLHQFEQGGISSNTYQNTAEWIFSKMTENTNFSCIIDDVIREPNDKNINTFSVNNFFYQNEVYHLINAKKANLQNILNCLCKTDAIWHSLIVLTEANLNTSITKKTNKDTIRKLCQKAKIIIVGAYDGEGYVFWEKQ